MKMYTKFMMLCAMLISFVAQAQFTHPMLVEVTAPSSIAASYPYGPQSSTGWGITALPASSVTGQAVWGLDITPDSLACDTITNDYTGKMVLIRRGTCEFGLKVLHAQQAGAVGCVICNNNGGADFINMGGGTNGPLVTIPAVMLSSQTCALIDARIAAGDSVSITFRKPYVSLPIVAFSNETPKHHIQTHTGMNTTLTNAGNTTATNIITTMTVTDPMGGVVTMYDTLASLDPDSVSVRAFADYTPVDTGLYSVQFTSTLGGDTARNNFHINPSMFALDRNSNLTWIGVTDAGFATANYRFEMGNVYLAGPNGGAATQVTYALGNNTALFMGEIFNTRVYEVPTTLTGSEQDYSTFNLVGVAIDTIDAADTTPYTLITKQLYNLVAEDSILFQADRQYLVVVAYQGTGTITQSPRFAYSGNDEFLSLGTTVFSDRLYLGGFSGDPHPVIRLNTRQYLPVSTVNLVQNRQFNIFPNPAKDLVNVDLALEETAANVVVCMLDINGRKLQENTYSNFTQQTLQFNTADLAPGFYFIRVQTEKGVQVKEFVKK